jgi:hypothetical protein
MVEQYENNYSTQLNGAIDSDDTTIVVDAAPVTMTGSFRIKIDNELILVGSVSGTSFTGCTRGVEGTTAASHSDNAIVKHVLTADALENIISETVSGIPVTTLGYNTVGASTLSPGADNRGQAKKVTITQAGTILGVSGYFKMVGGPGTGALWGAVYTDNAGVPHKPMGGAYTQYRQVILDANEDLGWFHIPVNVHVDSATDVWIVVGNAYQAGFLRLTYDASGTDYEITFSQLPWLAEVGMSGGYATASSTTRKHSIRAHFLPDGVAPSPTDPIDIVFGTPDTAYEFDTTSLTGLTSLSTTPDVMNANTTVPHHLYINDNAGTGGATQLVGLYASKSPPFTAICKVGDATTYTDYNWFGMFCGVATPGKMLAAGVAYDSGVALRTVRINSPTDGSGTVGNAVRNAPFLIDVNNSYFCVRAASSTDVSIYWSRSGYIWYPIVLNDNNTMTVGSVGLYILSNNTTAPGMSAAFDYLRIWDSTLTIVT